MIGTSALAGGATTRESPEGLKTGRRIGSSHVLRGSGEKIAAGICFKSTDSGACRPLSVYTDSLELLYSGLFLAGRVFMAPGEVRVSVPKCRIELVHRLLEKSLVITQPGFSGFD